MAVKARGKVDLVSPEWYKINEDSIILAALATAGFKIKTLDAGCGNGIVGLTLWLKAQADVYFLELQSEFLPFIKRNISTLGYDDKVVLADFTKSPFKEEIFQHIVFNPPYRKGDGKEELNDKRRVCMFEKSISLEKMLEAASTLLCKGGLFEFVYPVDRYEEVFDIHTKYGFNTVRVVYVKATSREAPYLFFASLVKGKAPPPFKEEVVVKEGKRYMPWIARVYALYGY